MLVDSHSHFDAPEFDGDRAAAHARALAAGVHTQVLPAVDAAGWPKLKLVCTTFSGLFPAYGLHPMYLEAHRPQHLAELRDWIEREAPVAVGECGLDHFVEGLDLQAQQFYFDGQLRLAREFDLPVIVHARRAVDAVIASIRKVGALRDVVQLVGVVLSLGVFLSPVLFPITLFPAGWRWLLWLNPRTAPILGYQSALLQGVWPGWDVWLAIALWLALLALLLSLALARSRDQLVDWL